MNAPDDLAAGFAEHLRLWARNRGAPPEALEALALVAGRASLATAEGSVCVPLAAIAQAFAGQPLAALRERLLASQMVGSLRSEEVLPLVLDDSNRLYLRRYFDYERRLAQNLVRRAAPGDAPPAPGATPDGQRDAVELAMRTRLAIVSGAPGTGKTTAVAMLLERILGENPEARIALAAPTGKAAARMLDALRERAASAAPGMRERLPAESHTIHRLLGVTPQPGRFRHHAGNPLPLDAVVVDEASMLDLALAVHLVEAVPPGARLVFLGDKDQLAAVEAGSVFAELSAREGSPLARNVVWLTENHRFAPDSGIGRLAALVNAGEAGGALDWLRAGGDEGVALVEESGGELGAETRRRALAGYDAYIEALRRDPADRAAVFRAFERFRVLCAVRETRRGVNELNRLIAAQLRAALEHPLDSGTPHAWYPGRPVMVMQNDTVLRLFNGDVGICLPAGDGSLAVWFADARSGFRDLAPGRLPPHEDAFATTVHKAQGSQFDEVLLVLPAQPGRSAVRELLYTAVTRARQSVAISSSAEVFAAACTRAAERHTGLLDRMHETSGSE
jgi:exodeoxyribonuclease V alpha subunit